MARNSAMSSYRRGAKDAVPFMLVIIPFAVLFGVVATEAGLSVLETLTFSVAVVAGAAQFAALQLMLEDAATAVVLASALAVNLRHAMYSASLVPHLGGAPLWQRACAAYLMVDQTYAMAAVEYERAPDMTIQEKMAYFFGTATPIVPTWYAMTVVGAMVGNAIPQSLALDFALPITFIALIAPMLRTLAHVAAAATAVVMSLVLAGLPYNLGLISAGLCGMIAGAHVELRLQRLGLWT